MLRLRCAQLCKGLGHHCASRPRHLLGLGGMTIQTLQGCDVRTLYPACAGIAFKGNAFGAEEAATTLATNFAGTRAVCERVLPLMPEHSRIVNVCRWAFWLGRE